MTGIARVRDQAQALADRTGETHYCSVIVPRLVGATAYVTIHRPNAERARVFSLWRLSSAAAEAAAHRYIRKAAA